jgi:hypothetical protein
VAVAALVVSCLGGTGAAGAQASRAASRPLTAQALRRAPLVSVGRAPSLPAGTLDLGALPLGRTLHLGIALRPRDPQALAAAATAVSTPGSLGAGRWLSPRQWRARFGPSAVETAEVSAWLRAGGWKVGTPSANGLILPTSATVSRVQRLLHVEVRAGRLPGHQRRGWEAVSAPLLPSPIAGGVIAVLGLDELATPHDYLVRGPGRSVPAGLPRTAVTSTPHACAAARAGASNAAGWTFDQIAQAYGLDGIYGHGALGGGQTVAIFELEPYATSDLRAFDECYFGADHTDQVRNVAVDGGIPPGPGSGEATLDVEDVSALAPAAHIEVYEAPGSYYGMEYATSDIYNAMVSEDTANLISTSWGLCEPELEQTAPGAQEVEYTIFEEAALQGQSVFTPAGDSGSNDCTYGFKATKPALAVDDPASQPFVVAVGGTSLLSDTQPPHEVVWNDGAGGGGGGGGISATWRSPAWQSRSGMRGVSNVYSSNAAYDLCKATHVVASVPPCREVPDVTLAADENHGSSFYEASYGGWSTIGGTSTATPMWAAISADIASSAACSHLPHNPVTAARDLGFIAPALYETAAGASANADFNDITSGNNDVYSLHKGYPATAGYDLASGLGSPIVTGAAGQDGLGAALCGLLGPSVKPAGAVTVTSVSPSSGDVAGGTKVTVKGVGFGAGTVTGVDFGGVPARSFTKISATTISAVSPGAEPGTGVGGLTAPTPGRADITVTVSEAAGAVTSLPQPASLFDYVAVTGSGNRLASISGLGPSGGPNAGNNSVTIYGSGFVSGGPVSAVTFGSIRATKFRTLSDVELRVLVPARSSATRCARGVGYYPSAVCQVQVVVTGRHGKSRFGQLLPPYYGATIANNAGVVNPAPGTEIDPGASEYDYAPEPVITSISPDTSPASGSTAITISGRGFSLLTLNWVNFGPAGLWLDNDAGYNSVSPTTIVLQPLPFSGPPPTKPVPLRGGVSILSLGGLSAAAAFSYGPN